MTAASAWGQQDSSAYITAPTGGDPLNMSLEKVRVHAHRMESAMVRSRAPHGLPVCFDHLCASLLQISARQAAAAQTPQHAKGCRSKTISAWCSSLRRTCCSSCPRIRTRRATRVCTRRCSRTCSSFRCGPVRYARLALCTACRSPFSTRAHCLQVFSRILHRVIRST